MLAVRKTKRYFASPALLFALVLASAGLASADVPFTFTFSIDGETGYGSLSTTSIGNGAYLANSGTMTVVTGSDQGTYSLIPITAGTIGQALQSLDPALPAAQYDYISPTGAFDYDNILYPDSDPTVDEYSLLFGGANNFEINIWGNSANNYTFYDSNGNDFTAANSSVALKAPEPSAVLLLAAMLMGVGFAFRRSSART